MVAGLILAAGMSRRMCQPKMLLSWRGQPLVRHLAQVALAVPLTPLIVVTGHVGEAVAAALGGLPLVIAHNPDFEQGQSTSLIAGIRALGSDVDAVAVLLVDQPLVTPELLLCLVSEQAQWPEQIIAPSFCGQRGNPVIFPRGIWPELLTVTGDRGARAVIQRSPERLQLVPVDTSAVIDDVDTPAEYAALQNATQREGPPNA
ncbi:MAG: nucleotidyltransferase family protein [Herpetosiphonaceae bacterium]|nr:nucleotidyltransferase family protein [Herpetosiphonaceae bacterium]